MTLTRDINYLFIPADDNPVLCIFTHLHSFKLNYCYQHCNDSRVYSINPWWLSNLTYLEWNCTYRLVYFKSNAIELGKHPFNSLAAHILCKIKTLPTAAPLDTLRTKESMLEEKKTNRLSNSMHGNKLDSNFLYHQIPIKFSIYIYCGMLLATGMPIKIVSVRSI